MTEERERGNPPEHGAAESVSPMSREEYLRERDAVYSEKLEASRNLDTTLITLSGGAVALSVTFLDKIRPESMLLSVILTVAWVLFVLSVLLTTFSHFASMRAKDDYLDALDQRYQGMVSDYAPGGWEKATRRCNRWSLICFAFGIVMIGVFGAGSLYSERPNKADRGHVHVARVAEAATAGIDTTRAEKGVSLDTDSSATDK